MAKRKRSEEQLKNNDIDETVVRHKQKKSKRRHQLKSEIEDNNYETIRCNHLNPFEDNFVTFGSIDTSVTNEFASSDTDETDVRHRSKSESEAEDNYVAIESQEDTNCRTLSLIDKIRNRINRFYTKKSRKKTKLISDSTLHTTYGFGKYKDLSDCTERYGLVVDRSRLRGEEYEILKRNWDLFCNDYDIDDELKVILLGFYFKTDRYSKEEKIEIKRFRKITKFYMRLAKDLPNRLLDTIYHAVKRRWHPLKSFNELTEEDIIDMKSYYFDHKIKRCIEISDLTDFHPNCVTKTIKSGYNRSGQPFNAGKWTAEEEELLEDGLKGYLWTEDLRQHIFDKNISFETIQAMTDINRSNGQCRAHWVSCLRWNVADFDQMEDKWTHNDSSKLIYRLFKLDFESESDIDWHLIKEMFPKITSFYNLMKNWTIIKSIVPDFESKSYQSVVEYLYDNYLPQFIKTEEQLKELEDFCNY